MKTILVILLLCLAATAAPFVPSDFLIVGHVVEVTDRGLVVECEDSDRIGYKRATGRLLLLDYPNWKDRKEYWPVKCFGKIQTEIYKDRYVYRFTKQR